MTKKNYLQAVSVIIETNTTELEIQLLIDTFVDFFKDDNPRFDEVRFRKAFE